MAAEPKVPTAAILDRLSRARAMLLDALEQIDDAEALAEAKPTLGKQAQVLVGSFCSAWHTRYKTAYVVANEGQAIASAKKVLRSIPLLDLQQRIERYLDSRDAYLAQAKHPLGLFLSDVNRWAQTGLAFGGVIGCDHAPACESEADCTRRRMAVMRERP